MPLVRDAVRSVDVGARRIDVDLAFLGEARRTPRIDDGADRLMQLDVFTLFPEWFDWFREPAPRAQRAARGQRAALR